VSDERKLILFDVLHRLMIESAGSSFLRDQRSYEAMRFTVLPTHGSIPEAQQGMYARCGCEPRSILRPVCTSSSTYFELEVRACRSRGSRHVNGAGPISSIHTVKQ
jgi:hypothetical protein